MPIWLRKYYIKKLVETKQEERAPAKNNTSNKMATPPIIRKK